MIKRAHPNIFIRKSKRLFPFILFIITGFAIYQTAAKYIVAHAVECYTQYGPCPEKYLNDLNWTTGISLLKPLPHQKIISSLDKYQEIKNISVYRRFPQTLIVGVMLRKSLGTLGPQVLGLKYISDEEGYILGEAETNNLPLLLTSQKYIKGNKISETEISALNILNHISQIISHPVTGQLNNLELFVYLPLDQKVVFNLTYLPSNWTATLQVILERSKIHSKIPKVIDLRFSEPIITF